MIISENSGTPICPHAPQAGQSVGAVFSGGGEGIGAPPCTKRPTDFPGGAGPGSGGVFAIPPGEAGGPLSRPPAKGLRRLGGSRFPGARLAGADPLGFAPSGSGGGTGGGGDRAGGPGARGAGGGRASSAVQKLTTGAGRPPSRRANIRHLSSWGGRGFQCWMNQPGAGAISKATPSPTAVILQGGSEILRTGPLGDRPVRALRFRCEGGLGGTWSGDLCD